MKTIVALAACIALFPASILAQYKADPSVHDSIPAANLRWTPFDKATMWVQAGTGIGFAAAGITVAYAASPKNVDPSGVASGIAIFLGVTIAAVGVPLGTYMGGTWMGGNGGWWATLGGCVAGGIIGLVPNIFIKYDDFGVTALIFVVAAVAGGTVAYNLSASPVYDVRAEKTSSLRLGPNVEGGMRAPVPGTYRQHVQITVVSIHL